MLQPEIIETNRLILRGFSEKDITYIFDNFTKTEIKKTLGHSSDEEYEKELYKHKNGYASYNRSFMLFLLVDKNTQKTIGRCGIHNWNKDHQRAEIGYNMTDENFKNQGFMTEALAPIIAYGFQKLNLNRLEAIVNIDNMASLKLIHKNNFVKEAQMKKYFKISDAFEDAYFFALLKDEYKG